MKKILIVILLMFTVSSCASSPAKMPQWKADSMSPEAREKADAYYHFMIAALHEQDGEYDAAMEEYQAAYRLDPDSAEIALSLVLLVGHLYLAVIHPATRHALRGMVVGTVREEWAREHHPRWTPPPA